MRETRAAAMAVMNGFGVAFDGTGAPTAIEQALAVTGRGATLVIWGALINLFTHRRTVALLGELDLAPLITHAFPIAEIETALNLVGLKER